MPAYYGQEAAADTMRDWLIRSNTELGEGYSDIVIWTSDKVAIIIELN